MSGAYLEKTGKKVCNRLGLTRRDSRFTNEALDPGVATSQGPGIVASVGEDAGVAIGKGGSYCPPLSPLTSTAAGLGHTAAATAANAAAVPTGLQCW